MNEAMCSPEPTCCDVEKTINDRLNSKRVRLEAELKDVSNALEALAANPEVARVLTLVGKVVGRL